MTFEAVGRPIANSRCPDHQETGRDKFFNPMTQVRRIQARHRATDCALQVLRHRETGRVRFQNGFNLAKEGLSGEPLLPPRHCRGDPKKNSLDDMSVSLRRKSADLPPLAKRSKRPSTSKPTGRHNVFTYFPKDPDCEVCKFTETTRTP